MLTLENAVNGFKLYCKTSNLSPNTIVWYESNLKRLIQFNQLQNIELSAITVNDLRAFISAMQDATARATHPSAPTPTKKLAPTTIHAFVRTLAVFFNWAEREQLIATNPMSRIERPKVPRALKPPFDESELQRLFAACESYPDELAARNRAILRVLLDTMMRANELCGLTMANLDPELRRAKITGKGMKDRYVPLGKRARSELWKYIHQYRKSDAPFVFLTRYNRHIDPSDLYHIVREIADRAEVKHCHPHRFRHTGAVLYLKNGGDVYSLQEIMGHEDLSVTRLYVQFARSDIEQIHNRASPGDNLKF